MALESGTFVSDLVSSNPPGTDPKNQGDDHLRLVKAVLQATFPDADKAFYLPGVQAKSANYPIVDADENDLFVVDSTGADRTITLPTSPTTGFLVRVMKGDASGNTVIVDGGGAETINGAATSVLTARYETETYIFDGTEWKIVSVDNDTGGFLSNVVEDTSPQLGAALDTNAFAINESEGTSVSGATPDIWQTDGNTVHITGATTITSFGTAPRAGAWRKIIFDGTPIITDGANLNLPGGVNITAAIDDFAFVYAETTTLLKVIYFKASGLATVAAAATPAGGWVPLERQVVSGDVSSVDFETGLDSTYESYVILVEDLAVDNDDTEIDIVIGTGGTPTYQTGNTYRSFASIHTAGSANETRVGLPIAKIPIMGVISLAGVGNAAQENFSAVIHINNPSRTGHTLISGEAWWRTANGTPSPGLSTFTGTFAGATDPVTAVRIRAVGADNINEGIFTLYGIQKGT